MINHLEFHEKKMNNRKLVTGLFSLWHIFISIFAVLLYLLRCANTSHVVMPKNDFTDYHSWYGVNGYLILIAVVAFLSGILLGVKKTWGSVLSIILGTFMVPLGLYLAVNNLVFTSIQNQSFMERLVDYFRYMGASLSYIDLVCIFYGIFAMVYFTRNRAKA